MKKKSRDRLSTLEILKLLKRNYNKFPKRYSLDIVVNVLPTGGVSMLAGAIKNNYLLSGKPFKSTNARILYGISGFGGAFMRGLIFPQLYNEFNLEGVIDNVIFHPFEGLDYIGSKVKTYLPAIVSKVIAATAMNTYYGKYELPYIYKTIRGPNQQSSESVDQ